MKLDYEQLDRYVTEYQKGNPDAAEAIIEAFKGYLLKYELLILYGQFDIGDPSIRNFLALFVKDRGKRAKLNTYRHNPAIRYEIYRASNLVHDLLTEYDAEDLRQDLILVLLMMAKRYRQLNGPGFHNYVLKAFHLYLFDLLKSNPVVKSVSFNDELYEGGKKIDIDKIIDESTLYIQDDYERILNEGQIDDNWVNGIDCSDKFRKLTILERKILKCYYVEKKGDQEIANLFGTCRATINRRRQAIKRKLMEDKP